MENVEIKTEFITLGQFVKFMNLAESGGMVKWFLSEHQIMVNGIIENRRGKKLYPSDHIIIRNHGEYRITRNDN